MGTYEKALNEFRILESIKYEKEDNKPLILDYKDEILALVKKFGESGQSGGSASYTANAISATVKALCLHNPIGPITGEDSEWVDITEEMGGQVMFQNNRVSSVFKNGKEGKPYFLDAIVFKGETVGDTFTGEVEGINSRRYIRQMPFYPKIFYIDVTREKIDADPHDEEVRKSRTKIICGDGVYIYHIKDPKQLEEVFKIYEEEEVYKN